MPKRFTPEQIAASAAIGELRTQHSFGGDTEAWHTYQDTVYSKLRPGEALHASRPVLWKAAARQLKKIEAERNKPVKKVKKIKKHKVSTRKEYPGVSDVQLGSPRPSACGMHVVCQLSANVNGYGTCVDRGRVLRAATRRRRERRGGEDAGRTPSAPGASRAPVDLLGMLLGVSGGVYVGIDRYFSKFDSK